MLWEPNVALRFGAILNIQAYPGLNPGILQAHPWSCLPRPTFSHGTLAMMNAMMHATVGGARIPMNAGLYFFQNPLPIFLSDALFL
jgi:hypothetical protein